MNRVTPANRQRGAAAVLAMMFLVIFASLATAMAIVSQGNLSTADASLKINRSLAAAETGMNFLVYRMNQVTDGDAGAGLAGIKIREGEIDDTLAQALWTDVSTQLQGMLAGDLQYQTADFMPYISGTKLVLPYIAVAQGQPTFSAVFEPHPIAGEDYDDAVYQRPPYSNMDPPVSGLNPMGPQWVRMTVTAKDGPAGQEVYRSITMDFQIEKKIRFALLSKSRVMIGRNVMIDGQIGSAFTETNLENGHPIQMESDFVGLDPALDAFISPPSASVPGGGLFHNTLAAYDADGDNRIALDSSSESAGLPAPASSFDYDKDGYVDEFDYFLSTFDANGDLRVSLAELDPTGTQLDREQLMTMIDTFGDPLRAGYNDGFIDEYDRYAKIRGQVYIVADKAGWEAGAADPDGDGTGAYQDFFQGPIHPDFGKNPLTFDASSNDVHEFEAADFNVSSLKAMATNDFAAQAGAPSGTVTEAVPYGAAYPYEYYDRPVYDGVNFDNVIIPKGTNALFRNCTFTGVTFIDTAVDNDDPNFNYAGMQEADGTLKHPGRTATVDGVVVVDTKTVANNIRFDDCTFNGAIVTEVPTEFTHVRNKMSFTGTTKFVLQAPLTEAEKKVFRKSTLMAPHFSVEMGTFIAPDDIQETVEMTGTIITGLIDMRGKVKITGTLMTTFEPISNTGPVLGETSPQFNTTLGYFAAASGDLESELPANGVGVIQVRYDPTLPLPDGILGHIDLTPNFATYREGGQ